MKILIIEDNRDIAENIDDYLSPRGHQLDFAHDGQMGLNLALAEEFEAIVLDLNLPRLDGLSVCKQLRQQRLQVPILMLTARDQLDDKLIGFEVGADDYLVKPFSVKELEARLTALHKRAQPAMNATHYQLADLEFDSDSLSAKRRGISLTLNPIQCKLLLCLFQHSPKVVRRETLERAVWGEDPPDKDILRTHIYSLRNTIDKPYAEKLLHTVHGVGYRLATDA